MVLFHSSFPKCGGNIPPCDGSKLLSNKFTSSSKILSLPCKSFTHVKSISTGIFLTLASSSNSFRFKNSLRETLCFLDVLDLLFCCIEQVNNIVWR